MSECNEARAIPIADAMQALPLPQPPRDGWPLVRARLHRRRRQRVVFALAASIALAGVLGVMTSRWQMPDEPPATVAVSAPSTDPALQALQHESRELEALLAWSGEPWVDTGDSALIDHELNARLQQVDLLLASTALDDDTRLLLWSERVHLLRQRSELAGARLLLADGEHSAGDVLLTL